MVLKTFFLIFEDWSYIGIITFRKFENNTADFKLLKPLIFMLSVLNKKAKLTLARRHCCPCRFKQMDHFSNVLFYNFEKGALNPNFSILTLNMKKKITILILMLTIKKEILFCPVFSWFDVI